MATNRSLGITASLMLAAAAPCLGQFSTLMSMPNGGGPGNGPSVVNSPSCVSAFGQETFYVSTATNIFPTWNDGEPHVYVHDRTLNLMFPVGHYDGAGGKSGVGPNGESGLGVSRSGRYVVYSSSIKNQFLGKTTSNFDIFLLDRDPDVNGIFEPISQTLSLISVGHDGSEPNGHSYEPSVSDDGKYVAFASDATNLVAGDANGVADIYIYNTATGQTSRVSPNVGEPNGASRRPFVSTNVFGTVDVAFTSAASNLVQGDTNGVEDAFLVGSGGLIRLSEVNGVQGNSSSSVTDIGGWAGRYVMIETDASNLVNGDTNVLRDVLLLDRDSDNDGTYDEPGATSLVRVSVDSAGAQSNGSSGFGAVSIWGRFAVFTSAASNLVASDTDGQNVNVFLHDRDSDADGIFDEPGAISTTLVSLLPNGQQAVVSGCALSFEGGTIAFDDMNGAPAQVYLHDTETLDWDGDALLDSWEMVGIDVQPKDGVTDLTLNLANPMQPDLYVEVDAMAGMFPANQVAFQAVARSFLQSTIEDDGVPITLHYVLDPSGQDMNAPVATWTGTLTTWPPEFGPFKAQYFGSPQERANPNWPNIRAAKMMAHRYCVFAFDNVGTPVLGQAEVPGNDFYVALGGVPALGALASTQAGVFMHELGHNLGLQHGGADTIDNKPNYHSVMNGTWTLPMAGYANSWWLNFSANQWWPLDETGSPGCMYEPSGIGGTDPNHALPGHRVPYGTSAANFGFASEDGSPVDWNLNGTQTDVCPVVDVNFDGQLSVLNGWDDWANLWWQFGGNVNFSNAVHGAGGFPTSGEMEPQKYKMLNEMGNWWDTFDQYAPGEALTVVGGWEPWCEDGREGFVSSEHFLSPPHSVKIEYDGQTQYGTDIIKPFMFEDGQHTFSVWTFVPSGATGSGYVVMLNTYCEPEHNWSLIVEWDADLGIVRDDGGDQLPLIFDQWIEFRAEIDLDADTLTHFYNGIPLSEGLVWSSNVLPAGKAELAVLDLFSLDITEMYFDSALMESEFPAQGCEADVNGDGSLDILDFVAFQNAFLIQDPVADCDGNGLFDILDFVCFQNLFQVGCE